jgi:hypothetical protein
MGGLLKGEGVSCGNLKWYVVITTCFAGGIRHLSSIDDLQNPWGGVHESELPWGFIDKR